MNIPDDAFFTLLEHTLSRRGHDTLQRTLYRALREAILQEALAGGSRLPGARVIATRLNLSRNTINGALEQLTMEGYLQRSRQGTYVATLTAEREGLPLTIALPERLLALPPGTRRDSPTLAFTPGTPAINYFPLPIWRRLLDKVLREEGGSLLGYGEAAGELALR
ncbi:GntR family transcriptional regulator, partial [Klebsiella quasipneumoniae]